MVLHRNDVEVDAHCAKQLHPPWQILYLHSGGSTMYSMSVGHTCSMMYFIKAYCELPHQHDGAPFSLACPLYILL